LAEQIVKTRMVCARCRRPWRGEGSPAYCPDCNQLSYPVAIERKRTGRPKKLPLAGIMPVETPKPGRVRKKRKPVKAAPSRKTVKRGPGRLKKTKPPKGVQAPTKKKRRKSRR
jgi:hypothetical protein